MLLNGRSKRISNYFLLILKKDNNYNNHNMIKKIFTLTTGVFLSLASLAQPTLSQGGERAFTFKKQPRFTAHQNSNGAYFIFKSSEVTAPKPTMVALDNTGNVIHVGEVKFDGG